ncbi:MAG: hypothetical protein ABI575_07235 [Oxalobacteraceae bacterium]
MSCQLNLLPGEKRIEAQLSRQHNTHDPQVLQGPPILEGNAVEVLVNGDVISAAMLKAIRGAQKTITFETYIYWSGALGRPACRRDQDR